MPEETAAVAEYVKLGGDVTKLDKPEQFVIAMMGIPMFKQRLQAFAYMANFQSQIDDTMIPLERLSEACEGLLSSERLKRLLMAILKVGNILNQSQVAGFKAGVLPKLEEIKTTTKPPRTFVEFLVDILWEQDRDCLKLREELKSLEELGRFDMGGTETAMGKIESGFKALTGAIELVAKHNASASGGELDPLEKILREFCSTNESQLPALSKAVSSAKEYFVKTAKMFGETDASVAKIKPEAFLRDFIQFVRAVDAKRSAKEEKLAREAKRKASGKK